MPDIVSVVVTTGGHPDAVRRCLGQLRDQSREPDAIVAVDGSTDDLTYRLISEAFPDVNYVRNPGRQDPTEGAWEVALTQIDDGIVVFLNDDVSPASDWLAGVLAAFADPALGGIESASAVSFRVKAISAVGGIRDGYRGAGPGSEEDLAYRVAAGGWRMERSPGASGARPAGDGTHQHYSVGRNNVMLLTRTRGLASSELRRYFTRAGRSSPVELAGAVAGVPSALSQMYRDHRRANRVD